jgi:hypothetical protein
MVNDGISIPAAPASLLATRRLFLVRTYQHLLAAVVAFVLLEITYFKTGLAETIAGALLSVDWLFVLGGFIVLGWIARAFAAAPTSRGLQYAGLAGYVLAESLIFVPLLYVADAVAPGAIESAATLTVLAFVGLTTIVFATREDFSFLAGLLRFAGLLALIAIVGAVLFGLQLGTWFSIAMIGLAGCAILYETSHVLQTRREEAPVSAALELFASVALLFWYAVRLFMARR